MRTDGVQMAPEAVDAVRDTVAAIYGKDMVPVMPRCARLPRARVTLPAAAALERRPPSDPPSAMRSIRMLWFRQPPKGRHAPAHPHAPSRASGTEPCALGGGPTGPACRVYKSRIKNSQEAHEAIRPTKPELQPDRLPASLEPDQRRLYQLIWARAVASQMADAIVQQVRGARACVRRQVPAGRAGRAQRGTVGRVVAALAVRPRLSCCVFVRCQRTSV